MEPTQEDLVAMHRDAQLWRRLRHTLDRDTAARGVELVELAVVSIRECLAGAADVRKHDQDRIDAYNALEALVTCDVAPMVTITHQGADRSTIGIEMDGDTITRDDLTAALLSMGRARGVARSS